MRRSGLVAALVAGLAAAACGPDQELYTFELESDEPPLDVSVREVEREPDRSELEVRPYDRDRRLDFLAADCAMDELARRRGFERSSAPARSGSTTCGSSRALAGPTGGR